MWKEKEIDFTMIKNKEKGKEYVKSGTGHRERSKVSSRILNRVGQADQHFLSKSLRFDEHLLCKWMDTYCDKSMPSQTKSSHVPHRRTPLLNRISYFVVKYIYFLSLWKIIQFFFFLKKVCSKFCWDI